MRLYHFTRSANAAAILAEGFREIPHDRRAQQGVWFQSQRRGGQRGPVGLAVDVPDELAEAWRVGSTRTRFCIPASLLAGVEVVRVSDQDAAGVEVAW